MAAKRRSINLQEAALLQLQLVRFSLERFKLAKKTFCGHLTLGLSLMESYCALNVARTLNVDPRFERIVIASVLQIRLRSRTDCSFI